LCFGDHKNFALDTVRGCCGTDMHVARKSSRDAVEAMRSLAKKSSDRDGFINGLSRFGHGHYAELASQTLVAEIKRLGIFDRARRIIAEMLAEIPALEERGTNGTFATQTRTATASHQVALFSERKTISPSPPFPPSLMLLLLLSHCCCCCCEPPRAASRQECVGCVCVRTTVFLETKRSSRPPHSTAYW
jgi:hypothetical protein